MMRSQVRKTGGMFFDLDDVKFIIDPGPGALVHAHALDLKPDKWNGIFLSHFHVDNCSDANTLIDCMKDPFLVAEQHCILPREKLKERLEYYPRITEYHSNIVKYLHPVKDKDSVAIGNMKISIAKAEHIAPAVGFMIKHPKIAIAYPGDGYYYDGQEKAYEGCDILILNVLVPKGENPDKKKHMSVDDAIKFLRAMKTKPKLAILQHLSFWMLRNNVFRQAKILQDATKTKVLIAEDFMELDLETLKTKILKVKV